MKAPWAVLIGLLLPCSGFGAQNPPGPVETTIEAWGHHYRLNTDRGGVHVWVPKGYDSAGAGAVIYLHGYYTNADQAWEEANLAEQFRASGRNALFIVPESPNSSNQAVQWPSLGTLLDVVRRWTPVASPRGPLVVIGHSGAFRTVVDWLKDPRVKDVVLLDGLYRDERDFYWWLLRAPGHTDHRLRIAAIETLPKAEVFVRRLGRVSVRPDIPGVPAEFTPAETRSRVLLMKSQYEHMELVTSGKVIPVLLRLPPLPALPQGLGSTTSAGR
jgi:hypothetical protein